VPALADIQLFFRNAVVTGDVARIRALLSDATDPENGLGIHRRNYEVSLVTALLTKFPATVWLAGTSFVTEAARDFIRHHPPQAPCIAEYGDEFPRFLAGLPGADGMRYLGEFAELERQVGQVSVEIEERCLALADLAEVGTDQLPDIVLQLQPGIRYRKASWPIDDLLKLYLTESAPDCYAFEPCDVWLEVRGARGEFQIDRLELSEFAFRYSIAEGRSIGSAAESALEGDPSFDPGTALVRPIESGIVTKIGAQRPPV
jgi:Putative DNA-binding domain